MTPSLGRISVQRRLCVCLCLCLCVCVCVCDCARLCEFMQRKRRQKSHSTAVTLIGPQCCIWSRQEMRCVSNTGIIQPHFLEPRVQGWWNIILPLSVISCISLSSPVFLCYLYLCHLLYLSPSVSLCLILNRSVPSRVSLSPPDVLRHKSGQSMYIVYM